MQQTVEYPGVTRPHLVLAKAYSSPALSGPPMCDELVALVEHMFTDEEAEIVQHIKPFRAKSAANLARQAGRPLYEVKPVLQELAHEKYVILEVGHGPRARFTLMPVVPGTFEAVLMKKSTEDFTEWHRRFAELFEALFSTGYLADYSVKPTHAVRYLPVGEVIEAIPTALPSDRLEDILDHYDKFSIATCQCRSSKKLLGEDCGRMIEVCTAFGDIAVWLANAGKTTLASKQDVLEVKAAAEKEGLVTWMFNVSSDTRYNGSCSCCGCCCGALRTITQFNAPGMIAPPHFMPRFDNKTCVYCDKCVKVCPMGALSIVGEGDSRRLLHESVRCIGCGLCAVSCNKSAVAMREMEGYKESRGGWPRYALKNLPNTISNMRSVSAKRKAG